MGLSLEVFKGREKVREGVSALVLSSSSCKWPLKSNILRKRSRLSRQLDLNLSFKMCLLVSCRYSRSLLLCIGLECKSRQIFSHVIVDV